MTTVLSYLIWFFIGMLSIYLGAYIRYKFFNKQNKSFKSFSKEYFYPNFIIGVYIFLILFLFIRYLLGYELVKG